MPSSNKVLCRLFWTALGLYLLGVAAVLVLRYAVLPQADQWRVHIEQMAGRALDAQVRIDHVAARWSGLHPRFTLTGVRIVDDQGQALLRLPRVQAVLSWRSVLGLSPRFLSLALDEVELTLRRDARNRIWVANRSFALGEPGQDLSLDTPLTRWLARQGDLVVRDARLHWQDELRGAPGLTFEGVSLRLHNSLLRHQFVLRARPPAALAAGLEVQAETERGFLRQPARRGGQVYLRLDDAEPLAWRPWLDVPDDARGRMAMRGWGQIHDGRLAHVMLDLAARDLGGARAQPAWRAGVQTLRLGLQGAPGDLLAGRAPAWLASSPAQDGLQVTLQAGGIDVELPRFFEQPLPGIDALQASFSLRHAAGQPWSVHVSQALIRNGDLSATLQGSWRGQGRTAAGTADFGGQIERAAMNAIHRYLPLTVSEHARQWLARGLPQGQVTAGSYAVSGDLADFPYEHPGEVGQFRVQGRISGADVDYAPARPGRLPWPMLQGLSGSFAIDRDALSLQASGGIVRTSAEHSVALLQAQASIPHMSRGARLHVQGTTEGPAPAYLAMVPRSPLGGLLGGVLDRAQASGHWQVPLALDIPLTAVDDTQVRGSVAFNGGDFVLGPGVPPFRRIQGTLGFTEQGVSSEGLRGQFLGGPYTLSGTLAPGAPGLAFSGTLSSAGLQQLGAPGLLGRMSGRTAYRGSLLMGADRGIVLTAESDLRGMALDFPAPLDKAAAATLPLSVRYEAGQVRGPGGTQRLTAGLGQSLALRLERDAGAGGQSYFQRGALGIDSPAELPGSGLRIQARLPRLDLDAWRAVAEQASGAAPAGKCPPGAPAACGASTHRPAAQPRAGGLQAGALLPRLSSVDLRTETLLLGKASLEDLQLQARSSEPGRWQATLASRQAAGTLDWQAPGQAPGRLQARLSHLALGRERGREPDQAGPQEPVQIEDDAFADLPDVDLRADQLLLYGRPAGALVLQGSNRERGRLWHLDTLALAQPSGRLQASGVWRTSGAQRGMSVNARLDVSNLGELLKSLGHDDLVGGGKGRVQAELDWRGFPWQRDYGMLQGKGGVSLDAGRFVSVNSRSARLLELLALQSAQRLARLDFAPGAALSRGFSFDTLRGALRVGGGQLSTPGLKVDGPAATIVLDGSTDLQRETLAMHAVVVPNLDAGGAAIAAGIAINPVLGVGAFLTQWLLREPLARAMTVQYAVSGTWDDPKVREIQNAAKPPPAQPQP